VGARSGQAAERLREILLLAELERLERDEAMELVEQLETALATDARVALQALRLVCRELVADSHFAEHADAEVERLFDGFLSRARLLEGA
jgi:hypothetical protein